MKQLTWSSIIDDFPVRVWSPYFVPFDITFRIINFTFEVFFLFKRPVHQWADDIFSALMLLIGKLLSWSILNKSVLIHVCAVCVTWLDCLKFISGIILFYLNDHQCLLQFWLPRGLLVWQPNHLPRSKLLTAAPEIVRIYFLRVLLW